MSAFILDFVKTSAIPALGMAVLFYVLGLKHDPWRARLQALVLALAFAGGSYIMFGRLAIPPYDVSEAFTWAALGLAVFVWVAPYSVNARYVVRALFVVGLGALCLWPIRESLQGSIHMRNLFAFFFLGLGVWSILEKAAQKVKPLTLVTLPLLAASGLAGLLMLKGSASMAQQMGIVCTLLGAVFVLVLFVPRRVSVAAVLPFISVFLVLFMCAGHFYLDINPWFMVYLSLPFFVLWIREWLAFVSRQPVIESVILGALSAAPLGYFLFNVYKSSGGLP